MALEWGEERGDADGRGTTSSSSSFQALSFKMLPMELASTVKPSVSSSSEKPNDESLSSSSSAASAIACWKGEERGEAAMEGGRIVEADCVTAAAAAASADGVGGAGRVGIGGLLGVAIGMEAGVVMGWTAADVIVSISGTTCLTVSVFTDDDSVWRAD
jgi:hypothetical protein